MTIFLIGYMASGKTTLGRALARKLGMTFIDLDFFIEQRFRRSISEIFGSEGEGRFREIEREMLREAGEFCNTVISCGGGTPCHSDNMDYMNSRGVTILLETTPERTVERLLTAKTRRPIVERHTPEELPAFIKSHMEERAPFYSKASLKIDSTRLESRSQIEETLTTLIPLLPEQDGTSEKGHALN